MAGASSSLLRQAASLSAALAVAATAASAQARTLVTHADLTAVVAEEFVCAGRVNVGVLGKSEAAFAGERRALQRLVGGVRAILGFECKGVEDIVLVGVVDGREVWRGLVSAKNGWVLVSLPAQAAPAQPPSPPPAEKAPQPARAVAAAPRPAPPPEPQATDGAGPLESFGGGSLRYDDPERPTAGVATFP